MTDSVRAGPSVRHLAEKMAQDARTGIGFLTDDDVALLFLRYQVFWLWKCFSMVMGVSMPLLESQERTDVEACTRLCALIQREFNRSIYSGAYTHASMTDAFYNFAENARR